MFQSRTLIITIVTTTTTIISGGTARSPPRYGRAAQTSGSAREFEPFHQTDKKYLAPIKNESTMHIFIYLSLSYHTVQRAYCALHNALFVQFNMMS